MNLSVLEIEKGKRYKITVPIGYNGNKRINHYEVFYGGKREAIIRENEIKMRVKTNSYVKKNNLSMAELVEEWLANKKGVLGIKTYEEYKRICNHIVSALGHLKIKDINAKILEDFYNELRVCEGVGKNHTGYSEKTIKHHYTMITEIFNSAIKWGYLLNNPNKLVSPIKVHKKEIQCYSPDEVEKLITCLQKEPIKYQALILLAIDSGCREGELTGLTWEDINFKKSTVTINKTTQYVPGYGTFEKAPKTDTSNRTIYVSTTTINLLKQYKLSQEKERFAAGSKWKDSNRVFTTDLGEDMHPGRPYKILKRIIKKYNLKDISFHGLRHTSISLQISSGIQAQIISKRAGHSSVGVTHSIYSHFFDEEFKEVASAMDGFLKIHAS